MALLRSVLGTITQSMGGVTATTWKGKNVLKQKVAETNTSNTPAQAQQRSKFAALAKLGGLFGPQIRLGYRVAAAKVTEQNAFYTANKDAVSYVGGVAVVNYAALKLSTGIVGGVSSMTASYTTTTGSASVRWMDNSNGGDALPSDQMFALFYHEPSGKVYFSQGPLDRTEEVTGIVDVPAGLAPADFVAYGFFKRMDSTATSPSSYSPVAA